MMVVMAEKGDRENLEKYWKFYSKNENLRFFIFVIIISVSLGYFYTIIDDIDAHEWTNSFIGDLIGFVAIVLFGLIVFVLIYETEYKYYSSSQIIRIRTIRYAMEENREIYKEIIENTEKRLNEMSIHFNKIEERKIGRIAPFITLFPLESNDIKIRIILSSHLFEIAVRIVNTEQEVYFNQLLKRMIEEVVTEIVEKYNLEIHEHKLRLFI